MNREDAELDFGHELLLRGWGNALQTLGLDVRWAPPALGAAGNTNGSSWSCASGEPWEARTVSLTQSHMGVIESLRRLSPAKCWENLRSHRH